PLGPLVLGADASEVRIGGRIDRVDVAEGADGVVFWIIDYKTGRASNYSGTDLAQFKRLQLSLYALAVERVVLAGRSARPLGLAYWLVTDSGPKIALPGHPRYHAWYNDGERWEEFRATLEEWGVTLVKNIRQGVFPLKPRAENCTETCP